MTMSVSPIAPSVAVMVAVAMAVLAIAAAVAPMPSDGAPRARQTRMPTSRPLARWRSQRETRQVEADLADLMEGAARGVRAGLSLPVAIADAATRIGGPLAADLHEVSGAMALGLPFHDAVGRWRRRRTSSEVVALAVDVLLIASRAGGRASLALEGVAATLRERTELARDVRTHAAQARASAAVMVLLPPVFLVVSAAVDPSATTSLVATRAGLVCLALGIGLEVIAALWMRRIMAAVTR